LGGPTSEPGRVWPWRDAMARRRWIHPGPPWYCVRVDPGCSAFVSLVLFLVRWVGRPQVTELRCPVMRSHRVSCAGTGFIVATAWLAAGACATAGLDRAAARCCRFASRRPRLSSRHIRHDAASARISCCRMFARSRTPCHGMVFIELLLCSLVLRRWERHARDTLIQPHGPPAVTPPPHSCPLRIGRSRAPRRGCLDLRRTLRMAVPRPEPAEW